MFETINLAAYIAVLVCWPVMSAPVLFMENDRTLAWGLWAVGFGVSAILVWSIVTGQFSPGDSPRAIGQEMMLRLAMIAFSVWPAALSAALLLYKRANARVSFEGWRTRVVSIFALYAPSILLVTETIMRETFGSRAL